MTNERMMKRLKPYLAAALLLSLSGTVGNALAYKSRFDDPHESENPNVEEYVWKEAVTELPPYPEDGDLIEFQSEAVNPRFRYFIDARSISVSQADGVVRYTLVIRSDRGSNNISHEGMRCSSAEYKIYAYGSRGKFRRVRQPKWRPIEGKANYSYRKVLFEDAMCATDVLLSHTPERIVQALKFGPDDRTDAPFR